MSKTHLRVLLITVLTWSLNVPGNGVVPPSTMRDETNASQAKDAEIDALQIRFEHLKRAYEGQDQALQHLLDKIAIGKDQTTTHLYQMWRTEKKTFENLLDANNQKLKE